MDWSSCWCWLALLALGIVAVVICLIKSSKQLFAAAAFVGIICIIPPQEAAFFGTADLKKITIGDHVLGQYLGLLGRFEHAIRPAPAILAIDMPRQLPVQRSRLANAPDTISAAITQHINVGWSESLLWTDLRVGSSGISICIHRCGGGQRRAGGGRRWYAAAAAGGGGRMYLTHNKQSGRGPTRRGRVRHVVCPVVEREL